MAVLEPTLPVFIGVTFAVILLIGVTDSARSGREVKRRILDEKKYVHETLFPILQ